MGVGVQTRDQRAATAAAPGSTCSAYGIGCLLPLTLLLTALALVWIYFRSYALGK